MSFPKGFDPKVTGLPADSRWPESPEPKPHGDPIPWDVQAAQGPGAVLAKCEPDPPPRSKPFRVSATFATNDWPAPSVAESLQRLLQGEIDGTVIPSYGFGHWGVEAGVTVVATTPWLGRFKRAIVYLLKKYNQEAAYVEVTNPHGDTRYVEWNVKGEVSPITGDWS